MLCRVVWEEFTDVLDVHVAFVIIALMMEVAGTCEMCITSTKLHGATSQKTAIFMLAAVRT
jgi:hypothetical protein